MPRAVSPWTWRRALRDHGPKSPSVLLTLFVIGTFMDRDGRAFPGQQLIAKGIRGSVKTVQRHIEIVRREGWLHVETAGRGGKGWRHYAYRAAIPDHVDLDDLDESIADSIEAIEGSLPESLSETPSKGLARGLREDTIVSPASAQREDTIVSPRKPEKPVCPVDVQRTKPSVTASVTEKNGVRHDRGDTGESKVATNGAEGGDISSTSWRHNSVALTPALRTPASITRASEEAHNAQSRVASPPPDTHAREKTDEKIADRIEKVFLEHVLADITLSTTDPESISLVSKATRYTEQQVAEGIARLTAAGRLPIKRRGITPRENLQ